MAKLILMRHGESCWNQKNIFTGWVDVPLSPKGIEESLEGGKKIQDIPIDIVFTSTLVRAQMTAFLALSVHRSGKVPVVQHTDEDKLKEWSRIYSESTESETIPVIYSWHLNERMYGELQGKNKVEMAARYGADQIKRWRRSYHEEPPNGESLAKTAARTIPYFQETILPFLAHGLNVFISAHGNSLRSICMVLNSLSEEEVIELEIPTGIPIIYDYRDGTCHPSSI